MLIAADRNPYAERAILLGPDGRPISHFAGTGRQTCESWLNRVRNAHPGVPIVASPLDRWPDSQRDDPDIRWLHAGLVKRLYSVCLPWNLQRKLHRAHLFAYLYEALTTRPSCFDLPQLVRDFELQAAYRIIDSIP
jgi:hypothetical protein